ncbi:MAG: hypothetical protein HOV79_09115 [Hamadaea sp.]|nr:hypothetical protein [Hamadaea sp.]
MPSVFWALGALAVGLPPLLAAAVASGPLTRSRLESFARLHRLPVTVDNGNQVIRYLAVTRRWRCAGLGAGAAVWVALNLPEQRVGVSSFALFSGWFAGALAAELHLARTVRGLRRSASLRPRTPGDYVRPHVWWLPVIGTAALAVPWAYAAVLHAFGRAAGWPLGPGTIGGLLVLGGAVLIRRRILWRPQPPAAADVVRADDAIRSRSLHVLSAAAFVLAVFCAAGDLAGVTSGMDRLDGDVAGITFLVGVTATLVGVLSANARPPLRVVDA